MQVIDFDSGEGDLSEHLLPECALVQVLGITILYQSPGEITCNTEIAWIIGTLVNFNIVGRRKCLSLYVTRNELVTCPRCGSAFRVCAWEALDVQGGKHWCENCGDLAKGLKWSSWNDLCYMFLCHLLGKNGICVCEGFLTWWTKMICKNTKLCDIH